MLDASWIGKERKEVVEVVVGMCGGGGGRERHMSIVTAYTVIVLLTSL